MRLIARLGLLTALFALAGVASAAACSLVPTTPGTLSQHASIIVVGTISAPTDDAATLEIEQYLKGGAGEREITLLNRWIDLGPDCSRSLGAGGRFAEGTRLLLFLEPNTFPVEADWQTDSLAMDAGAAWAIVDDQVSVSDSGRTVTTPLAEIISQVTAELGVDGTVVDPTPPPPPTLAPGDQFIPPPARAVPPPPGLPAPTPTPLAAAASAPSTALTTTLPWALIGIGVVSGGLALWGWARSRRAED
jgi:hypothetical protein